MKQNFENLSLKKYILSFLTAFLLTAVFLGLISVLFSFFSPPDWLYNSVARYFCYASASVAAFLSAAGAQKNGLVTGMLCADIYMLLLVFAGAIIFKNSFPSSSLLKIFGFTSVFGGISGILGINFKK